MLIEKADWSEGAIGFYNKDVLHIRCITEGDALFCKTLIDLILHLIDHNDRVSGYPALNLEKKRGINLFIREVADQFRFLKETFLWGRSLQRGMWPLVIASDKDHEASSELFQCMKIPHIQECHPLILQGVEPSLNLGLLCGGIRSAIADHRSDPGSQKFHLLVLIGRTVIKVENLWFAILGNNRFHNGHKIYEGVVKKNIRSKDKSAGIIDQCDYINTMLLPISGFQIGTGTGIPASYLVEMWAFITAHILIVRQTFLEDELVDKTASKSICFQGDK